MTTQSTAQRLAHICREVPQLLRTDVKRARAIAEEGETLAREIGDRFSIAQMLMYRGRCNTVFNVHTQALKNFSEAARRFGRLKEALAKAKAHVAMSNSYLLMGRYQEGRRIAYKALKTFQEYSSLSNIAEAYRCIGRAYYYGGKYDKSLEALLAGLDAINCVFEPQEETLLAKARILNGLAILHCHRKSFREGLRYFTEVQSLFIELGFEGGIAMASINIGNAYADMEQFEQAERHYSQAIAAYDRMGYDKSAHNARMKLGELFMRQDLLGSANATLRIALSGLRKMEEIPSRLECLHLLGIVCCKQRSFDESLIFLQESLDLAQKSGDRMREYLNYRELATVYEMIGDSAPALKYLKLYAQLSNEINGAGNCKKVEEILHRQSVADAQRRIKEGKSNVEKMEREAFAIKEVEQDTQVQLEQYTALFTRIRNRLARALYEPDLQRRASLAAMQREIDRLSPPTGGYGVGARTAQLPRTNSRSVTRAAPILTPVEGTICGLIRIGCNTQEIANRLSIGVRTVETHRRNIRQKFKLQRYQNLTLFIKSLDVPSIPSVPVT